MPGESASWPGSKKQLPRLARKRVALFFTGAMPPEPNTVAQCVAQNLTDQEQKQVRTFYLWGGLNYQAMGPVDRWMMGVFRKMLAAKKGPSPEDQMAAKMVASSYDKNRPGIPAAPRALSSGERKGPGKQPKTNLETASRMGALFFLFPRRS